MDWLVLELGEIKKQAKEDFRLTMTAMATQRDALGAAIDRAQEAFDGMKTALRGQEDALQEHARRTDARFDRLAKAVEKAIEFHDQRLGQVEAKLAEHDRKLDDLSRRPPAA